MTQKNLWINAQELGDSGDEGDNKEETADEEEKEEKAILSQAKPRPHSWHAVNTPPSPAPKATLRLI